MSELSSWLTQNLETLAVLLTRRETAVGAVVGLLALWSLTWMWGQAARRRGRVLTADAGAGPFGAVWLIAGAVALGLARGLPATVAAAVVVAGASRGRLTSPGRLAAVAGAGVVLALDIPGGGVATRVAVAGALPVAVAATAWWPRHGGGRLLPTLLAVTVAGHVAVLPDVEEVLALAAVAGILVIASLPPLRARFGEVGAAGAAALVVWTAGIGGYGRTSAVVGGLAALGAIVAVPVGLAVARRRTTPTSPRTLGVLVAAHLAVVLVVTRNAGLRDGAGAAWVVAGAALALLAAAVALVGAFRDAAGRHGANGRAG